jgi:hypothetical protein
MKLASLVDRQFQCLRYRRPVVVFGGRGTPIVEHSRRCCFETVEVIGDRDLESLTIGRRLFVSERQSTKRLGQHLGHFAFPVAAGSGDQIVGANLLGPEADFDRFGDAAPAGRVRCDQDTRRAASRQVGPQPIGVERVVENQQDALYFVTQPFHDRGECRLFFIVRADPGEPYAERNQIGAHGELCLGPNPPCHPIVGPVSLSVSDRNRRLADPS